MNNGIVKKDRRKVSEQISVSSLLPLPVSPRQVLIDIKNRVDHSAATWKDANLLRRLALDERMPPLIRVCSETLYSDIAVPCAAAAVFSAEWAIETEDDIGFHDLAYLQDIARSEELPIDLRHSAAHLVELVR